MTGRLLDTFDCHSATDAIWDVLPVVRSRPGRDDVCEHLNFRLLMGSSRQSQGIRAMRAYIFSEADLNELYTLDINEDDFQTLKADQGILVDFVKFADKIVDLVQKCIDANGEDLPKFKAVLDSCDGEFVFKLVETNDFKQIPHISLAFRQGNDHAIQCFLAFRTLELKAERDRMSRTLTQQGTELAEAQQMLSICSQKLQVMETRHAEASMKFECRINEVQASTHRELVKQREDLAFAHDRAISQLKQEHIDAVHKLQSELGRGECEVKAVRTDNDALRNELVSLQTLTAGWEADIGSLKYQLSQTQSHLEETLRAKELCHDELVNAQSMLSTAHNKISSLQKMMILQQQQLKSTEIAFEELQVVHGELMDANSQHQIQTAELADEVQKGNAIVDQLTEDLSTLKGKLKKKQARICEQAEEQFRTSAALKAATAEVDAASEKVMKAQSENHRLENLKDDLLMKLQNCKAQLQGNEKLIRWLNTQVNDKQMQPLA